MHTLEAQRLRATVCRIFNGTLPEMMGELFQNAQRAGATTIWITTERDTFTVQDNGHGITSLEGWITLLTLGGSSYEDQQVQHQHPMGVGIHSVLAHEGVERVTFESNGSKITIADTDAWWNDVSYYAPIFDDMWNSVRQGFMGERSEVTTGFRLTVQMKQNVQEKEVRRSITGLYYDDMVDGSSLVASYADYLEVYFNGEHLVGREDEAKWHPLFTFTYEGAEVVVSSFRPGHYSVINWYGQRVSFLSGTLAAYVKVRSGRPFDLLAPSRRGVIENDRWQAFIQALRVATFQHILNNLDTIPKETLLYYLETKDGKKLPVFAASIVDAGGCADDEFYTRQTHLFRYDEMPFIISKALLVWDERTQDFDDVECGAASFLDMLEAQFGRVYVFDKKLGDETKIPMWDVYWRPGDLIVARSGTQAYHEFGSWGVSSDGEEPTEWFPVTSPVIAVKEASGWGLEEASFISGGDPVQVLQSVIGFARYANDECYDDAEAEWKATVNQEICGFLGNDTIPMPENPLDLRYKLPTRTKVVKVEYAYDRHTAKVAQITVTNVAGETKTFNIYYGG